MADKYFPDFSAECFRQEPVTRCKIWMPPLENHPIPFSVLNFFPRRYNVERVGGIDQEVCWFYSEHVITEVSLFPLKEQLRILHFIGNHFNFMFFSQCPIQQTGIVGDAVFIGIYRPNQYNFFLHHVRTLSLVTSL